MMVERKHSPGRWRIDERYPTIVWLSSSRGVLVVHTGDPDEEDLANAVVISVLPDLWGVAEAVAAGECTCYEMLLADDDAVLPCVVCCAQAAIKAGTSG